MGFLTLVSLAAVHCLLYNSILLLAICVSAVFACFVARSADKGVCAPSFPFVFIGILLLAGFTQLPYLKPFASGREWNMLVKYPLNFATIWTAFSDTIGQPWPWMSVVWLCLLIVALCAAGRQMASLQSSLSSGESKSDCGRAEEADTQRFRRENIFFAINICLALAAYYVFLKTLSYLPGPRNFFALIALLAVAIESILEKFCARSSVRLWKLGIAVTLAIALFWPAAVKLRERQTNVDLVVQKLSVADPHDLIVVLPWFNGVSFNWYYHGQTPWTTLPDIEDHRTHRYDLMKAKMMAENPITNVLARIEKTLQSGHTVWVIGNLSAPEPGQLPPVLPPAPGSQWGWSDAPYDASWSLQFGHFLQMHALKSEAVDVPVAGVVSEVENLPLTRHRGWR